VESKWRQNVTDWAGFKTSNQLIARILSGPHAGRLLCKVTNARAAIVNEPPLPGILPTPVLTFDLTPAMRFPYGYDVEPD